MKRKVTHLAEGGAFGLKGRENKVSLPAEPWADDALDEEPRTVVPFPVLPKRKEQ